MGEPLEVKVGDKLFVTTGHYDKGTIDVVDRITPTGRIITKRGTYGPDGWLRGSIGFYRARARKATEDDLAGVYRYGLVSKITAFRLWEKLSADDLKAVADIVKKYSELR